MSVYLDFIKNCKPSASIFFFLNFLYSKPEKMMSRYIQYYTSEQMMSNYINNINICGVNYMEEKRRQAQLQY